MKPVSSQKPVEPKVFWRHRRLSSRHWTRPTSRLAARPGAGPSERSGEGPGKGPTPGLEIGNDEACRVGHVSIPGDDGYGVESRWIRWRGQNSRGNIKTLIRSWSLRSRFKGPLAINKLRAGAQINICWAYIKNFIFQSSVDEESSNLVLEISQLNLKIPGKLSGNSFKVWHS